MPIRPTQIIIMKFHTLFYYLFAAIIFSCCTNAPDYTSYVDPFIGTAATGHTYPGAIVPFGMVSAGPDTKIEGWANCSGYHYDDSSIMGFSQTHLSGTGAADMGDIMLMPITGEPICKAGSIDNPDEGYRSRFSHDSELASPGYYSVFLDDYKTAVEITATEHCGFYRICFPENVQTGLLLDLEHGIGDRMTDCLINIVDDRTISGYRKSSGFVNNHIYYFYAEFSEPFVDTVLYKDDKALTESESKDKASKLYVRLNGGNQVLVKIALSTVSEEGAQMNLKKEIAKWDFDATVKLADKKWNDYLASIAIDTETEDQKTIFYTAMYHSLIAPNLICDVDGKFRGWDKEVHQNTTGNLYTNYSLWDTYRAVHPFMNLFYTDKNVAFINSMLERYNQIGQLPINEYGTCETYCMIGYHAIPVIAEAIIQGVDGFDYETAFRAMKDIAMDDARGVGLMKKYGFIPSELENNSVSKVLEYAYDDWCIAQVAKKLGYSDDYEYYIGRAANYKNHFDEETGFMRGRHQDGSWVTPFDPRAVSVLGQGDFTEGNSWQYSFYVPQDMTTYIEMMGGDDIFDAKLDTLFTTAPGVDNVHAVDVTGLIGQYAHGNEPSHHNAYLYNFAGKPWKTQHFVNRIKNELYSINRDGLCGNDDCGQMSCWYIFSSLGFYPVTPGTGYYVIGSPSLQYAKLNLPSGKIFEIKAPEVSAEKIYIQAVRLNGKDYDKSFIAIEDIMNGGVLEFDMGAEPNTQWAISEDSRPIAVLDSEL